MIGHTDNQTDIDAPIGFVWEQTNEVRNWPNLFTEYAAVEVLEEGADSVVFRLTTHPDEQGRTWSWVSERTWDKDTWTVRARRVETGPFEFMNLTWTYEEIAPDRTRLRWVQDFRMKPDAPVDTAQMTDRINNNSPVQLAHVKAGVERRRRLPVGFHDVPSNTRRGGDLRTLVAPSTVGSSAGFCGAVRLAPGEKVTEHYHPYSEEFLFVTGGELRVDLDGEPVRVTAEQGLLIPREVRHRLVNVGRTDVLAVFHLSPLAPRPELGHVDTETAPDSEAAPQPASAAS
ncbi:cupin domain-containing protein [Streptomyces ipomoeae]|uniref:cupin domain-containing protein n=1 Tax=Streptomyces ipomoeae TaxID=103232 RepID=UPI0011470261|nr:cupin domain-containing protein [Streptomyces ipomoeae]MDX2938462.1 cupin domain-containing protein [Streptomyces ipomoeae]TQE17096.1 cupin domain-containing protein [Streptomyces ipomoeae]